MGPGGIVNMNTRPPVPDDDWLDQALRTDALEHAGGYLPDDGFSAKVLARLPEPAALPAWRRPVLIALWAIVAVAAIAALPVWFDDLFRSIAGLLVGQRLRLVDYATLLALLGSVTWGALFFAARAE
jgi:hypothetical protein